MLRLQTGGAVDSSVQRTQCCSECPPTGRQHRQRRLLRSLRSLAAIPSRGLSQQTAQQAAAGYGLSASAAAGGGQLSAAARFVLQQMSHDGAQLELVMQHESNFSVQDITQALSHLQELGSSGAATAQGTHSSNTQHMLVRLLEERADLTAALQESGAHTTAALCRLLVRLHDRDAAPLPLGAEGQRWSSVRAAAEARASTRQRWGRICAAVVHHLPLITPHMSPAELVSVLQFLAVTRHPTPAATLLALLQPVLQTAHDDEAPGKGVGQGVEGTIVLHPPGTAGQGESTHLRRQAVHAVLQLQPHLGAEAAAEVKACLEECMLLSVVSQPQTQAHSTTLSTPASAPELAGLCAALSEACAVYGCIPPPEFVTHVLGAARVALTSSDQAPPAATAAAAAWASAAGLCLPHVATVTGAVEAAASLTSLLLEHRDAAKAVLSTCAHHPASWHPTVAASWVEGATQVTDVTLQCSTLACLSQAAGSANLLKPLLGAVRPRLKKLAVHELCLVGTACIHLQQQVAGQGTKQLAKSVADMSASVAALLRERVAGAHALQPGTLHGVTDLIGASLLGVAGSTAAQPLPDLAVAALETLGACATPEAVASHLLPTYLHQQPQLPTAAFLPTSHAAQTVFSSISQLGRWARAAGPAACRALSGSAHVGCQVLTSALSLGLHTLTPAQHVEAAWAVSSLSRAGLIPRQARSGHHQVSGLPDEVSAHDLLSPLSLAVWGGLGAYSEGQVARLAASFGRCGFRPGLVLQDMVALMRESLRAAAEDGGLLEGGGPGSSSQAGSSQAGAHSQGGVSLADAEMFILALSQSRHSTPSARALLLEVSTAMLEAHRQQAAGAGSLHQGLPGGVTDTSSLSLSSVSDWDEQSRRRVAGAPDSRPEAGAPALDPWAARCASMLWAHAQLGPGSTPAAQSALSQLALALLNSPGPLDLRHVANATWAAARLGLGGDRLIRWSESWVLSLLTSAEASHSSSDSRSVPSEEGLPQSLANWCWAMQQQGHTPSRRTRALIASVSARDLLLAKFKPQELCSLVCALVAWGGVSPDPSAPPSILSSTNSSDGTTTPSSIRIKHLAPLLAGAATQLEERLHQFTASEAAQLTCALARAGQVVSHESLQTIEAALTLSPICSPPTAEQQAASLALGDTRHLGDALLCQFMWACSMCGATPTRLATAYCAALPGRLGPRSRMSAFQRAQTISAACLGLGAVGLRASTATAAPDVHSGSHSASSVIGTAVQAIVADAIRAESALSASQMSCILHGLAAAGHCPEAWWRGGLLSRLRALIPAMSLLDIVRTIGALGQWPVKQLLGPGRLALLVQALRPVLLVHVLGAEVSSAAAAAASFDAAGEPTGSPAPVAVEDGVQQGSSSSSEEQQEFQEPPVAQEVPPEQQASREEQPVTSASPPAAAPAAPVHVLGSRGQVMTRPQLPPAAQQLEQQQPAAGAQSSIAAPPAPPSYFQPPLTASLTVDLATGCASLGIYTPELAEAVAGWAMQQPRGGLTRFTSKQLCYLLWAFASWRHDRLTLFEGAAEVIAARVLGTQPAGSPDSGQSDLASPHGRALQYHDLQRLVWAFSKFNRHPGEELLQAVHAAWEVAGSSRRHHQPHQAQGGQARSRPLPPLDALCTILFSLAILREHRHPLAATLAAQLGQHAAPPSPGAAEPDPLHSRPEYLRQARHVAACLLAAQAEQQESPLLSVLPGEAQAAAIRAWQAQVLSRAATKPEGYRKDVVSVARRMGLIVRLEPTLDGVAAPDVVASLPAAPALRFALELVGSHNSAANSGRLLGDAALKYRLLQARGYLVVPLSCKEWDKLGPRETGAKVMYVRSKLDKRLAALAAQQQQLMMAQAQVQGGQQPGGPQQQQQQQQATQVAAQVRAAQASVSSLASLDGGSVPLVGPVRVGGGPAGREQGPEQVMGGVRVSPPGPGSRAAGGRRGLSPPQQELE